MNINDINAGTLNDYLVSLGIQVIGCSQTQDNVFSCQCVDPNQQAQADEICKTFPPLDVVKQHAAKALYTQAIGTVEQRYPPTVQAGFAVMMATGKPNQAAYCKQLFAWGMSVTGAYAEAVAQINAATDADTINSISLDIVSLLNADPGVSLVVAGSITD